MALREAIIGFTGLLIAGLAAWQFSVAASLRSENAALEHTLNDKRAAELQSARTTCADRAASLFAALGYSEKGNGSKDVATFEDHYSERYARCLMMLQSTHFSGGHEYIWKTIFDTDERRTFGEYDLLSIDPFTAEAQPPTQCDMSPPDKAASKCHSTAEWNAFAKNMMSS